MNKLLVLLTCIVTLASCHSIDVYEKTIVFPNHEWKSSETPSFTFEVTDTTSLYNVFFILRHEDAYGYNNIYVNITEKSPTKTEVAQHRQFVLASNASQKWLASGMDDIYEHRIPFSSVPRPFQKGQYTFTLQQDMREDPLKHVLNVGIRIEKVK